MHGTNGRDEYLSGLMNAFLAVGKSFQAFLPSGRRFAFKSNLLMPARAGIHLALGLILMLAGFGTGEAREWSDPVRMTRTEGSYLNSGYRFPARMDDEGRVHVFFEYLRTDAQPDRSGRTARSVYQVFDGQGQSMSEPFFPSVDAGYPDSINDASDMAFGIDERVYLLWLTRFNRYLTILDSNGETISSAISIAGMEQRWLSKEHLFIDSQGNLVIVSMMTTDFRPWLGYKRFDPDGQPLDTLLHQVIPSFPNSEHLYVTIDPGDTLHIAFGENVNNDSRIRYYKVTPDDEIVIDDFWIEGIQGDEGIGISDLKCDSQGRPVFLVVDNDGMSHLLRFSNEMEIDLEVPIGRAGIGTGSSLNVDAENKMHVLRNFRDERLNNGYAWGYFCAGDTGNVIDSLQIIHIPQRNSDGDAQILVSSEGDILPIWEDYRFGHDRAEFYMRYSIPPDAVIEPKVPLFPSTPLIESIYPNPFNGTMTIQFGQVLGLTNILIVDDTGRRVYETELTLTRSASQFVWNGANQSGIPLPAGAYMVTVSDSKNRQSRIVTIVR